MAQKAQTSSLSASVFDVAVESHDLLQLAYNAYLANGRENHAKTLRRGEVSGGGKKPRPQKGTGRARVGSIRSPIWRKGGVVFGPLGIENYRKEISVRAKRVALRQALTLAARSDNVTVVDEIKTTGKTKDIVAFLAQQKAGRSVLLVADHKTPELVRATNNLPGVLLSQATYLNVFNVMNADSVILTRAALSAVEEWLGA